MPQTEEVKTEEIKSEESTEETTSEETTSTEEETSEETTEEKKTSPEFTQEQLEDLYAKNLWKQLKDPETSRAVIAEMARRAGFKLDVTETRQENAATLQELIRSSLGEDFDHITDKLAPALDKAINQYLTNKLTPLENKIRESEQQTFQREIDNAFSELEKDTKGHSKRLERRMTRIMDEIRPTDGQSALKYLKHVYRIAASESFEAEKAKRTAEQQKTNAQTTHGLTSGVNSDRVKSGSRQMSYKEAIEAAMKGKKLE